MNGEADDPMFDVLLSEALGGARPPDLSGRILSALRKLEKKGGDQATDGATPAKDWDTLEILALNAIEEGDGLIDDLGSDPDDFLAPVPLPGSHLGIPAQPAGADSGEDGLDPFPAEVSEESQLTPRQLAISESRSVQPTSVQRAPVGSASHPSRWRDRRLWATAVVAASIVGAILMFRGYDRGGASDSGNQMAVDGSPDGAASNVGPDAGLGDPSATRLADGSNAGEAGSPPPNTPIELDGPRFETPSVDAVADADTADATVDIEPLAFSPPPPRQTDEQIVAAVDSALQRYWSEIGVSATEQVEPEILQGRLSDLFGTEVALDPQQPLDSLRGLVGDEKVRRNLANRLAERLLGPVGRGRLTAEQREAFIDVLAASFGGSQGYDEIAGQLLTARGSLNPAAADFNPAALWYGALAGPRSVPVVEQFGHTMLDMDLRCARCHDHPLDGRVWQDQYWQLNAMFETRLRWTSDENGLRLDSIPADGTPDDPVVFYGLKDGRQRAAIPRAPRQWFAGEQLAATERPTPPAETATGETAAEPSESIEWIASSLLDNPQLAKAAVNQVWEMVYGQPLVGSAANPTAPPESPTNLQLQSRLAQQLRAYDFDLGRLVVWVAAARPMGARVPDTLRSPQFESANDEQLLAATRQVRYFAAFPHALPRKDFGQLLAIASPAVLEHANFPGELGTLGSGSLLGQIRDAVPVTDSGGSGFRRPEDSELLKASLGVSVSEAGESQLPAAWLERVGGEYAFQRRAEHLYFMAGYGQPSGQQLEVARLLRSGVDDDAEALRRLWWILSNQQ